MRILCTPDHEALSVHKEAARHRTGAMRTSENNPLKAKFAEFPY
jgi:hypothetical protein